MEALSRLVFTFLLNAVWQVSFVTALTAIAAHLVRNAAARYRHALWVMGLGLALLVPLTTLPESWRLACQSAVVGKAQPRNSAAPQHQPDPAGGFQAAAQIPRDEALEGTSARGVSRLLLLEPLRRHSRPIRVPRVFTYAALGIYLLVLLGQLIRLSWAWASSVRLCGEARERQLPAGLAGWLRAARRRWVSELLP